MATPMYFREKNDVHTIPTKRMLTGSHKRKSLGVRVGIRPHPHRVESQTSRRVKEHWKQSSTVGAAKVKLLSAALFRIVMLADVTQKARPEASS